MSLDPSRALKIGVALCFTGGLFPLTVGLIAYVLTFIGKHEPTQPWLAATASPASYSLDGIRDFNHELGLDFVEISLLGYTNLANSGAVILLITIFGLRRRFKWAWYSLLGIFLWVGLNDVFALLASGRFPTPIIPVILGVTGLVFARSAIFKASSPISR